MISTLINKQDNFEIIRDKIAAILATEVANQVALATAASEPDPDQWRLHIFTERSNPWEQWLNDPVDTRPIVNVWYDNSNFELSGSNVVERQKTQGVFNIDCYGYGKASDDGGSGHKPGDQEAAFEVQRALRLVRNILMADAYTYLDLRKLVWRRWAQTASVFQPTIDSTTAQQVAGGRLIFSVLFNEFSPQYVPETLDYISVDVLRAENGEVIAESDYSYPLS